MSTLRLPYPPKPSYAPQFAARIVETARTVSGVDLDYSVVSLKAVDDIIEGFRKEGLSTEQIAETLFAFGCYVGEVFVRNAGAIWLETDATPMKNMAGFPLALKMRDGRFCNPVGKVFKRLENGPMDNLPFFYSVFSGDKPILGQTQT